MNIITLKSAELSHEYRKKWNIHESDICNLYKNGEKVSDTLYRVGGFGSSFKDKYFCLIKMVEAIYPENITKDPIEKFHLSGRWCIINNDCIEKVIVNEFEYLTIIKDSILYSHNKICGFNSSIGNIETGEIYTSSFYNTINSSEYLFIEDKFNNDHNKRGVTKINKLTGLTEYYK